MTSTDYKPENIKGYCGLVFQHLCTIWDDTKNDKNCKPEIDRAGVPTFGERPIHSKAWHISGIGVTIPV
jgi:hypothetical protein